MAASLDGSFGNAREQYRQVVMRVGVTVTDTATIENHAMIEQRAVSLRNCLEFSDNVRQLGGVKLVDLANLLLLGRIAAMV